MNALEELAWNYPVTTATLGTFVLLGLIVLWIFARTFLWGFAVLFRNLLRPGENAPLWRKKRRSFASAIADEENDMSHGGC